MGQLTIAVDCDDVIINTADHTLKHYNAKYGTDITLDQYFSADIKNVWHAPDRPTVIKRINEYVDSQAFQELSPTQETVEVLRRLKQRHRLFVVTGRPDFIEASTLQWLEKFLPDIFERVILTNYFHGDQTTGKVVSKADVCREIGADILIEDNLHHAELVAEAGIEVLLFGNYPWNKQSAPHKRIRRVNDWRDVLEYINARPS